MDQKNNIGNKVYHCLSMSWVFHQVHKTPTTSLKKFKKRKKCSPAGSLLHPLISVQDTFQKLRHKWFEVGVGGLGDHPVCIATQGPASDGAYQGLLVTQTLDEVRDELWQIGHHPLHAAWATRRQNRGIFNNRNISV